MPLAQISILEGRGQEKIDDLAAAITEAIATTLDAPRDRIRVIVTEVGPDHWYVGGNSLVARTRADAAGSAQG